MTLKECYDEIGADYDDVMRRLRSEDRVKRFLKLFLMDQSFETLSDAMNRQDYPAAFNAVHTMKGICMNLSFTALQEACCELTENLRDRQGHSDTERIFGHIKEIYMKTVSAIQDHVG